ncbi:MAG: exonuclease SbcCD subunit D [Candidatus Hodarchaeota archaeon]
MTKTNLFHIKHGDFIKNGNSGLTTFIHASDLHLGSHQYRNEYRADDFIKAFQQILDISILNQADFILLGGDVFTSLEMLPGKLIKIINIIKEFIEYTNESIPIIAIEGNHDIRRFSRGARFSKRGQSWLKVMCNLGLLILLDGDLEGLPNSAYLPYDFNCNSGGKIRIKNVIIYGNHYLGENPEGYIQKITEAIEKEEGLFCVLLQHFGVDGQMQNVPGIRFDKLIPLKEKVDYLALGHYHLQFILDNWVYNPGSSEAACSVDSNFNRGIFIVKIKRDKKFVKEVHSIKLVNRTHIWKTINFNYSFKSQKEIIDYVITKLNSELNYKNSNNDDLSNPNIPILYLVLKGRKPLQNRKVNEKELKAEILKSVSIVDVRIYQKFSKDEKSLYEYLYIQ